MTSSKKQGWQLGEGPFAGNKGNKDPIRDGGKGDKPHNSGRQLDESVINRNSTIPGGASGKLPRSA